MTAALTDLQYAKKLVTKGVSILNSRFPNWKKKVKFGSLNFADPKADMLGQLTDNRLETLIQLGMTAKDAEEHGLLPTDQTPAELLKQVWQEQWLIRH